MDFKDFEEILDMHVEEQAKFTADELEKYNEFFKQFKQDGEETIHEVLERMIRERALEIMKEKNRASIYKPEGEEERQFYDDLYKYDLKKIKIEYKNYTDEKFDVLKFLRWLYDYICDKTDTRKFKINSYQMHKAGFIESSYATFSEFSSFVNTIRSISLLIDMEKAIAAPWLVPSTPVVYLTTTQSDDYKGIAYESDPLYLTPPNAMPAFGATFALNKRALWVIEKLLNVSDKDKIEIVEE